MLAATKRKRGPDSGNPDVERIARGFLREKQSEPYATQLEKLEDGFDGDGLEYDSEEEDSMKNRGLNKEEMMKENTLLDRVSNLKNDLKEACDIIRSLLGDKQKGEQGDLEAFNDFRRKREDANNDGKKRFMSEVLRDQRKVGRFGLDNAYRNKGKQEE